VSLGDPAWRRLFRATAQIYDPPMAIGGRDLFRLGISEIERSDLEALVDDRIPEGFQLEYKRQLDNGRKVLLAVCAMANTFGGIVLVGIDEDRSDQNSGFGVPGPGGLVGVAPRDKSRLSTFCSNNFVPPFDPEISAIEVDDGKVVLVVRVDDQLCPRPLTVEDRVMVRTESGNRPADLFRLRQLFTETDRASPAGLALPSPFPQGHQAFNQPTAAHMVIRAVGVARIAASSWRPVLGDRERGCLRTHLGQSNLSQWLSRMAYGAQPVDGTGLLWIETGHLLSTRIELGWSAPPHAQLPGAAQPVARVVLEVPVVPHHGPTHVEVTTDIIVGPIADPASIFRPVPALIQPRRLGLSDLFYLFNAFLGLYGETLRDALAELVPIATAPIVGPAVGIATADTLNLNDVLLTDPLQLVRDAPPSSGGVLHPSESLDPRDAAQRQEQSAAWLRQLLLDAHFIGVDKVVAAISS
jgi:Putative DNA-binding domain